MWRNKLREALLFFILLYPRNGSSSSHWAGRCRLVSMDNSTRALTPRDRCIKSVPTWKAVQVVTQLREAWAVKHHFCVHQETMVFEVWTLKDTTITLACVHFPRAGRHPPDHQWVEKASLPFLGGFQEYKRLSSFNLGSTAAVLITNRRLLSSCKG